MAITVAGTSKRARVSARPLVSVVMPCLDEAQTVGECVQIAKSALDQLGVEGEVVVSDNGSTDGSIEIAQAAGARVVHCPTKGYGNALRYGIEQASGEFLVMGDSDLSYDFSHLSTFVHRLKEGADLVMGNRFRGGIQPGAMPWKNRVVGNPVLTGFLNLLYRTGIGDAHCGLRGFSREAYEQMRLRCTGMEFASEMVVNAAKLGLRMEEVPTTLAPDGRGGRAPHLHPWRDGWRHLKFLMMSSPLHLFLIPGLIALLVGVALMVLAAFSTAIGDSYRMGPHWMILGVLFVLLGSQIGEFGLLARLYCVRHVLPERDRLLEWFRRRFTLERGLVVAALLIVIGLAIDAVVAGEWLRSGFGPLHRIREAVAATTLIALGLQAVFFSFLFTILDADRQR